MIPETPKRVQINGEWFDMNTPCEVRKLDSESEIEYLDRLRDEAIQAIVEIPPGSVDFSGCTSIEQVAKAVTDQIEITARHREKDVGK